VPPTQAEIDAAMQHASGNVVDSPASQGQLAAVAQGRTAVADTGELDYVISVDLLFIVLVPDHRRSSAYTA